MCNNHNYYCRTDQCNCGRNRQFCSKGGEGPLVFGLSLKQKKPRLPPANKKSERPTGWETLLLKRRCSLRTMGTRDVIISRISNKSFVIIIIQ